MKKWQKTGYGLAFALFVLFFGFASPPKAHAAKPGDITSATLKAKNAATITVTIGGNDFDFVDGDPTDFNVKFSGKVDGCPAGEISGFTKGFHQVNFGGQQSSVSGTLKDIQVKEGSGACVATSPATRTVSITSPQNLYAFFNWVSADTLQNLKGSKNYKKDASGVFIETSSSQCQDRIVVTAGGTATFYELSTSSLNAIDAKNFPEIASGATGCFVRDINYHGIDYTDSFSLCNSQIRGASSASNDCTDPDNIKFARNVAGTRLSLIGSASNPVSGLSTSAIQPTCESGSHTGFEWIFCGVIGAIDDFINQIGDLIESQLVFDTTNDFGDEQGVRQAWAALKNIATIVAVIVGIIMVISQIVSWGPFDAYTIKRVLPKLIIALIAIQLSWFLLSWFIELANDAGRGIADLMYAPFGGRHALSFATLLDNNVGAGTSTGLFTAAAIGIGIAGAIMNIFGIAALALTAFVAILVGFLVLVFRKILIILCVVFAPVAIICWVLPNTEKYWKLWHETFSKLLIMFPLVVALIASGRIFAYIAGKSDTNDILTFFLIVVGFFGPFLILPKTFQWGGRALGAISGITNDRSKGMFDRSRNFLGERQKQRTEQKTRLAAGRLAMDSKTPRTGFGRLKRGIDLASTGRLDPTRSLADPKADMEHRRKLQQLANENATYADTHAEESKKLQIQGSPEFQAARHAATMRNLDAQELSGVEELNVQTAKFDLSGIQRIDYDRGNAELSSIATTRVGTTRTFINPDGSTRVGEVTAEHVAQAADMLRSRSMIDDYTDPISGTRQTGLRSLITGLRSGTPEQQSLAAKIINEHPGDIKAVAADLLFREPQKLKAGEIAGQDESTLRLWATTGVATDRANQAALRSLRLSDEWNNVSVQKRQIVEQILAQPVGGQMSAADITARAAAGTLSTEITSAGGFGGLKPDELTHIVEIERTTPGVIPADVVQGARVELTNRRRQGAIV